MLTEHPTLPSVRALVPIADDELVPPPEMFWHPSTLHGQAHVSRVLVHAFRLVAATGFVEEMPRLWASVYLHDIARHHDGSSMRHGADAWVRLADLPDVQALFRRGGVRDEDYAAIEEAVTRHSSGELPPDHPHHRLLSLLKDADGLDRVRLGDLDVRRLRNPEAASMVNFAQRLFDTTDGRIKPSPLYFARLWPRVEMLLR
jgi:hypothetical protein